MHVSKRPQRIKSICVQMASTGRTVTVAMGAAGSTWHCVRLGLDLTPKPRNF